MLVKQKCWTTFCYLPWCMPDSSGNFSDMLKNRSARIESPTIRNNKPNNIVEIPRWNAPAATAVYRQGSIVNWNPQQMVHNSNTIVTTEPVIRNNVALTLAYLRFIFLILVLNFSSSICSWLSLDKTKRRANETCYDINHSRFLSFLLVNACGNGLEKKNVV